MKGMIYTDQDYLIIKTPLTQKVSDPWSNEDLGETDNICGVIAGQECTFNYYIDRSYKGKGPDISVEFYRFLGLPEEFRVLCKELRIQVEEIPMCIKCFKAIWGTHTWDGGPVCLDHEDEKVHSKGSKK